MSASLSTPRLRSTRWGLAPAGTLVALNLVDGLETNLVAGVLPLLQDEWGFSDTMGGAIPTAAAVSGLLVTLPAGLLADRFVRTRLLTIVVASWALLTTGTALATGFWVFFAVRVVLGSANSLDNPSASSLITDYYPPSTRSRVFAWQRAAWTVGASIGVGLGGVLGEAFGWRAPFLAMALPGLGVAFALWRLQEPTRGDADSESPTHSAADPPSEPLEPGTLRDALAEVARVPTLRAVYVGTTVAYLGFNGIAYWLPTHWEREYEIGEGAAAALTGVIGLTATILGSILGGLAGDRWAGGRTRGRIVAAGAAITLGGALLVVGMAQPVLAVQAVLILFGAILVVSAAPSLAAVIADVLPPHRRGVGYAGMTFLIALGGALGPLLIGVVSDAAGSLQTAFVIGVLPVVPGGLIVLRSRRRAQQFDH